MEKFRPRPLLYPRESAATFAETTYQELSASLLAGQVTELPSRNPANNLEHANTIAKIVLWAHISPNGGRLPALVQGAAVVGLEASTGGEGQENMDLSNTRLIRDSHNLQLALLNTWTGAELSREEEIQLASVKDPYDRARMQQQVLFGNYSVEKLLRSLEETGTRVEFLDAQAEHAQRLQQLTIRELSLKSAMQNVFKTSMEYDELAKRYRDLMEMQGAIIIFREEITAQQISQLLEKYRGNTAAIVYGLGHITLDRVINRKNKPHIGVRRLMVGSDDPTPGELITPPYYTVVQLLMMGMKVPQPLLQEAIIMDIAQGSLPAGHPFFGLSREEKIERGGRLAELWRVPIDIDSSSAESKRTARRELSAELLKVS